MKNTSPQHSVEQLTVVASMGRDYADLKMRQDGCINPALTGICREGYLLFAPDEIVSSKDRSFFDMATKLVCTAYRVVGAAIVIEAQVNSGKAGHGGKAPIHKEVPDAGVMILSETRTNSARTMLTVLRDEEGSYAGLEESQSGDFHITSGRYCNFVPRKDFNDTFCNEARRTIEHMKLDIRIYPDLSFLGQGVESLT
jgi:hypothetical protein